MFQHGTDAQAEVEGMREDSEKAVSQLNDIQGVHVKNMIYPQKPIHYDDPHVGQLPTDEEFANNQPWHRGWSLRSLKILPMLRNPRPGNRQAENDPTEKV
jgi:hypothetical protein